MRQISIPVNTTGVAGSATGSVDAGIDWGELEGLSIDYNAACPATADLIVSCVLPGGAVKTLYSKSNSNTDVPLFTPSETLKDSSGTATTTLRKPLIGGMLKVDIAQADPLTPAVTVTAIVNPKP